MKSGGLPALVTGLVLVFLYLPIFFLVLNSFNASRYSTAWEGWSFQWYAALFQARNRDVWESLRLSLAIGIAASLLSMVLGTLSALALHHYRSRLQQAHFTLVYLPIVMPEILMGISLLVFFVSLGFTLGLFTITLAHITFCISYVALAVLARLQDFDDSLLDAARDLGAGPWQTARRVVFPLLAPGILAGGLLAFTLSIDDFVITFFVTGPGATTLPLRIYGMIKHSKELPIINALSTLLLTLTFAAVWWSGRIIRRHSFTPIR
ncbi:MAG TPA: ABC transporter permease [Verrucomicrobiales bacterium]|nr:ABC transporter permease [Verrucomicrobiales bacterium]